MFCSTYAGLKWPPFAARGRLWRRRSVGIFPSKVWLSLKTAASYLLWNVLASSRVCLHRCHGFRIKGWLLLLAFHKVIKAEHFNPWLFNRCVRGCASSESAGNSIVGFNDFIRFYGEVFWLWSTLIHCFLSNAPIAFETIITRIQGSFLCLTMTRMIENLHTHYNTLFPKRLPCDIHKCNDFNILVWTQRILNAVVPDVWGHCVFTESCLVVFFCILSGTEKLRIFPPPILFTYCKAVINICFTHTRTHTEQLCQRQDTWLCDNC